MPRKKADTNEPDPDVEETTDDAGTNEPDPDASDDAGGDEDVIDLSAEIKDAVREVLAEIESPGADGEASPGERSAGGDSDSPPPVDLKALIRETLAEDREKETLEGRIKALESPPAPEPKQRRGFGRLMWDWPLSKRGGS